MKTVWKYPIYFGTTELEVPDGGKFIMADNQHPTGDQMFVWALVDPNASTTIRKIIVLATGETSEENLEYIHSIEDSHNYHWHIFEVI